MVPAVCRSDGSEGIDDDSDEWHRRCDNGDEDACTGNSGRYHGCDSREADAPFDSQREMNGPVKLNEGWM